MYISMNTLSKGGTSQPILRKDTYSNKDEIPDESAETARFIKGGKGEIFSPTPMLKQWIREGCLVVIDEAHNYLSQKNMFLQRIIREGRSKGVVVFFASQSPNDYQQKFFNFQELLEFAYIFQCDGVAGGSVQDQAGTRTVL